LFAAENPFRQSDPPSHSTFALSGCTAPIDITVNVIDPKVVRRRSRPFFDHPTLIDLLDAKQISWRYYSVGDSWNALWNGPSAIRHLRLGPDWSKVMAQNTQVLKDIANEELSSVSWVMPSGRTSDHPGNEGSGPSWVAAIVNAIGNTHTGRIPLSLLLGMIEEGFMTTSPRPSTTPTNTVFGCR
jgi:hypothetical protein